VEFAIFPHNQLPWQKRGADRSSEKEKQKEFNASKIYSPVGNLAERAKLLIYLPIVFVVLK